MRHRPIPENQSVPREAVVRRVQPTRTTGRCAVFERKAKDSNGSPQSFDSLRPGKSRSNWPLQSISDDDQRNLTNEQPIDYFYNLTKTGDFVKLAFTKL